MHTVWQQVRAVGMAWGTVINGRTALDSYDRDLHRGCLDEALQNALNHFVGPRAS